jgi:hypothetical protein
MHAAPHALCDLRLALPASASLDPYTRRPVHSVAHARLARRTRDIKVSARAPLRLAASRSSQTHTGRTPCTL